VYVLLWRSLAKDHLSSGNSAHTGIALYLRSCPLVDALAVSVVSIYDTWCVAESRPWKVFPTNSLNNSHEDAKHLKLMTNFQRLHLMRFYKIP